MGYPKLRDKCCSFQFVLWRLGLNLFTPGAQSRQGQWWQDSVLPAVRNPSVARCAGVVVPTMPAATLCRDGVRARGRRAALPQAETALLYHTGELCSHWGRWHIWGSQGVLMKSLVGLLKVGVTVG